MSQSPQITKQRIIATLEAHGCSWRDYILVGSAPCVCRWTPGGGLSALVVEDETLAKATVEFLRHHGVRSFETMEAVRSEFGRDGEKV